MKKCVRCDFKMYANEEGVEWQDCCPLCEGEMLSEDDIKDIEAEEETRRSFGPVF